MDTCSFCHLKSFHTKVQVDAVKQDKHLINLLFCFFKKRKSSRPPPWQLFFWGTSAWTRSETSPGTCRSPCPSPGPCLACRRAPVPSCRCRCPETPACQKRRPSINSEGFKIQKGRKKLLRDLQTCDVSSWPSSCASWTFYSSSLFFSAENVSKCQ